jgi:Cys-rich four helix bundle protein (predicted Tat secretion target)
MKRREMLQGLGVVAAAVATSSAMPQGTTHQHVHGAAPNQALINTANDCVKTGDVCLAHCIDLMATGDKSLGECAKSVNELRATCGALGSLAAQSAPSLAKLASLAADVCKNCEAACRKHEKDHAPCKACAEACAACATECGKAAAA